MPPQTNPRLTPGAIMRATGLCFERGGQVVLDDINLVLAPGDRTGVLGPNGVGKTTLLRVLAGLEPVQAGSVDVSPPGATIGYLAQDRERPPDETVWDYLERKSGLSAAESELDAATAQLAKGDMSPTAQERYSVALDRFNQLVPDSFAERASRALDDLGAPVGLGQAQVSLLSGGELARAGLAALMLSRFDLTLLDEPTNDLDFEGLQRLEDIVLGLPGGAMIVSHDRAFLARTVNAVLELGPQNHRAALFEGSWESYLQEAQTAARHHQESYDKFRQAREELTGRAQRERQWATSGSSRERKASKDNDKMARDFRVNRTEQLAARARRTEKALDRLDQVEKPWEPWQLQYTLKLAPRAGTVVARLDGAVVKRGQFCLGPVDLMVQWGDRLSVTGPNGSGKTTLVDAVLGRAELSAGSAALGPSVVPGELSQERTQVLIGQRAGHLGEDGAVGGVPPAAVLASEQSLLDSFLSATGLTLAEGRSLLAKFGLGADHVRRAAASLSPGERTRAQLAVFQVLGVNFLVLDEPTNHLDMPAIEQLELALTSYEGTLLIVSHDRRLLEGLRVTHRAAVDNGRVEVTAV